MTDKGVTVLFLGSGFSKAVGGVPIQKDFLDILLIGKRKEWIDQSNLRIGADKLSEWMLRIKDIELCMSHLHNLAYSEFVGNDKAAAQRAIINIRIAINEFMKKYPICDSNRNKVRDWIDRIKSESGGGLVVLTTNYDLLIEDVLGKDKYEYFCVPLARPCRKEALPLYKLHGSINWMEERKEDGSGFWDKELRVHDEMDDEVSPNCSNHDRGCVYEICGKAYTPILIPFFFQKDEWLSDKEKARWNSIFRPHWGSARFRLRRMGIDKFYFIGCGLPPADHHLVSWLLDILDFTKPEITIISKNDPGLLGKVVAPFNPTIYECGLEPFL